MDSIVKPIFDIILTISDRTSKYRSAIRDLGKNIQILRSKKDELGARLKDVLREVEVAERRGMTRTSEVRLWLERVERVIKEAESVLEKESQVMAPSCCYSMNCQSRYELAKLVEEKQAFLNDELGKGRFDTIAYRPAGALMDEFPLEPPVGFDSIFDDVWSWVEDETVRSIGIFGMGGIGKTTLMKKIHNKFLEIGDIDYDLVAWVVVSRTTNLDKIQETLWKKLKLPLDEWDGTCLEERASKILKTLKQRKFLLFLDDVWESIELLDIGVPCYDQHHHHSKIIVSTRLEEVCGCMNIQRTMKVPALPPDKALKLFREKVGEETWLCHWEIPVLAETIVNGMKGLPLALKIVGRAMARRRTPLEWTHAIEELKRWPSDFPGMEREIFASLKFSYDTLREIEKKCFLYCSIFPEDHEIDKEDVVDLWIGEGFFDEYTDVHQARVSGSCIIESLKRACLLEPVETDSGWHHSYVKMHDIVRDMALWIACERGRKRSKIIVEEGIRSDEPNAHEKWKEAERISLWCWNERTTEKLVGALSFSNLTTLVMRATVMRKFPDYFVECMPSLRVLDLQGNRFLSKLPSNIGQLSNLEHLNLASTGLKELPPGLKNLIRLRVLLINSSCHAPAEVISSLKSLRVFCHRTERDPKNFEDEHLMLTALDRLDGIAEISLNLARKESIDVLLSSSRLTRCFSGLKVFGGYHKIRISVASMASMENLKELRLDCCELSDLGTTPDPSRLASFDFFHNLRDVSFSSVGHLRDVTFLIFYAPRLQTLWISSCGSMEEVVQDEMIDGNHAKRMFASLTQLYLFNLPLLKRISRRALPFPSLERIEVSHCSQLKKLQIAASSGSTLRLQQIRGKQEWWDRLDWDDRVTKDLMSSKFVPLKL